MAAFSGVDFGVLADARARQHRRRQRVIGALLIAAALSALLGYGTGGGTGRRSPGPTLVTEASRGVTLRLPAGRAAETFTISAPAGHAYDVTLTAPEGSRIVVAMNIGLGVGWTLATRADSGCRTAAGRTVCLLHFAAGGNPGGTWTAIVRKASSPAVTARIGVVFMPLAGEYRSTS